MDMSGFASYAERIDAQKVRQRSDSFFDHFSQATLFFNSQSEPEKKHLVDALRFELGKVEIPEIRARMVGILTQIDKRLATEVAAGLGIPVPAKPELPMNHSFGADTDPKAVQPKKAKSSVDASEALSMQKTVKNTIKSRKVAALIADGFDGKQLEAMKKALMAEGGTLKTVAPRNGIIEAADGKAVTADFSFLTTASVLFDAVFVLKVMSSNSIFALAATLPHQMLCELLPGKVNAPPRISAYPADALPGRDSTTSICEALTRLSTPSVSI
jgi:catalase